MRKKHPLWRWRTLVLIALLFPFVVIGWLWWVTPERVPPAPTRVPIVIYEEEPQQAPPVELVPETPPAPEAAKLPIEPQPVKTPQASSTHPRIALVIDDVGLDIKGSERAERLPAAITLSFLPYAERLQSQVDRARDDGHEIMLHMPMEPMGKDNPGPGALLTNLSDDEIHARFEKALDSFTGFDGVNNHMGSKFTSTPEKMATVIDMLKQRGFFFLDSRTIGGSVGAKLAREKSVPTVERDIFLDDDMSADAVHAQLVQLERVAKRKGSAVAIGHPHAATLQALEEWIPKAQAEGFEFVPVRDLLSR